jgi:hypothetical protein
METEDRTQDVWFATVTLRNSEGQTTDTKKGLVDLPRAMPASEAAKYLVRLIVRETTRFGGLWYTGEPPHEVHAVAWSRRDSGSDRYQRAGSLAEYKEDRDAYMHPPVLGSGWREVGAHEGTSFIELDWQ